jgi:ATP-dependent DNA ligase
MAARDPARWFSGYCAQDGRKVRLYSRPGNDLTNRFPLIVERLVRLHRRRSAFACDDNGVALFNRVRYRRHDESIFLYAFDLIELNGDDPRRDPLEGREARLEIILSSCFGTRANSAFRGLSRSERTHRTVRADLPIGAR